MRDLTVTLSLNEAHVFSVGFASIMSEATLADDGTVRLGAEGDWPGSGVIAGTWEVAQA